MLKWIDVFGDEACLYCVFNGIDIGFGYETQKIKESFKPFVVFLSKEFPLSEPWEKLSIEESKQRCQEHFDKFM